MPTPQWHFETLQVHAGQEQPDPATGARAVPVYQTTSYVFDDCDQAEARFNLTQEGNIYSRLTNPTVEAFERRVAALEGGVAALATASGAAAVSYALQNLTKAGDHLVAARTIYGGTYSLLAHTLPAWGIATSFADPDRPATFVQALRPNTKAIFVESMGNPHSNIPDLEGLAELAHTHGIPLVVDNTFATPWLLRPLEHGADIVVHSATKFLGGHGVALGGVIVDGGRFDWQASGRFPQFCAPDPAYHGLSFCKAAGAAAFAVRARAILLRDLGACLAPLHAFLLLQGLETLSLRVDRHVENALAVVDFLAGHPRVERVNHPSLPGSPSYNLYHRYFPKGGGSIFTFEVKGDAAAARACIDRLRVFSLLANVADAKSLVIHPASTTHAQMTAAEQAEAGILPNTIRLSIGIEHKDDLLADLDQALRGV
ncbi:O-acetylhomoserine aminocarboxypropyltransferase/cysteine synthase family protein [Desulfovibrio legallii]|uniref:O-acetylhomoserine aminocarboxypropyltransferase/cysteine synthase n=1 Tax=Desulfovibrio legallii TaxID=571438 RepID=A0A6H3FE32_9BACT|nr:O-acetylhomoserine aminocarboxypropyltransferase/cysteine synthase family protein [Desulfovibrio legallii]RHH26313.1 O-acetylhomoserine aminocarboxypropyltransferase/cysteine synthase [Desulfovibrio sp. AM18-2]TBH81752.1 O-acetylhomoserine aminocarboxypropyltransferase/cysteine synthase [Desulfovibrio legallii]CAI3226845.1 O-acetylhomoserine sulfhydrylase (EC @ O-succinylhomoserine sulfhydrylase (EC [Desulfovibrio diazotrophicus]